MTREERIEKELEEMRRQRSMTDQELNNNLESQEKEAKNSEISEKKSIIKQIPGFRSGTWWKMIIAIMGYFLIAIFILGMIIGMVVENPNNTPTSSALASSNQSKATPYQSTVITTAPTSISSTPISTLITTTTEKTQIPTSIPTPIRRTWAPTPTPTYYQASSSSGSSVVSSSSSTSTSKKCWVNDYYRKDGTHVSGYWRSC
jgi:cytoskeletal protein RodZ